MRYRIPPNLNITSYKFKHQVVKYEQTYFLAFLILELQYFLGCQFQYFQAFGRRRGLQSVDCLLHFVPGGFLAPGHVGRDPDARDALQAGPDDVAGVPVEGKFVEIVHCEPRDSDDPRRAEILTFSSRRKKLLNWDFFEGKPRQFRGSVLAANLYAPNSLFDSSFPNAAKKRSFSMT